MLAPRLDSLASELTNVSLFVQTVPTPIPAMTTTPIRTGPVAKVITVTPSAANKSPMSTVVLMANLSAR